jgi:type IV secretion system protein VirD4
MSDKWRNNGGVYTGCRVSNIPAEPPPPSEMPVNLLAGEWKSQGNTLGYSGDRHLTLFGPMGSGKSRRVLMTNLIRLSDWSMVVIDTKGELAAHTAAHRAKTGSVLLIDPFGLMPQNYPHLVEAHPEFAGSHGLNPLASLDPSSSRFVDDCKTMAEALIKVDEKDKHWGQSARALVKGLLMACRVKYGAVSNLAMIRDLLGRKPEALGKWNEERIADLGKAYPAIAASLNRFTNFAAENRELFSILSTALTQSDWLDSEPIKADLTKGNYDFARLKTGAPHPTGELRPVTVYLILPPDYIESHATWFRVVLASILMPLLRDAEQRAGDFPVLFALDEYAALGHMEIIERNMAMMRGYGVKLLLILQDLFQLKDVHKDRWESFIANSGIRLLFAPQDATTQDYFSKLSGQAVWTYTASSMNTGNTMGGGTFSQASGDTIGEHKTLVPRYAPEHLGSMRKGQALLFVAETRSGDANKRVPVILPDPESPEAAALMPDVHAAITEARRTINGASAP